VTQNPIGVKMTTLRKLALAVALPAAAMALAAPAAGQPGKGGGKTADQAVDAAVAYLKAAQAEDGTWSKAASPGVTGIVLTGLLKSGKVGPDDPMAAKAAKFVESLADAKEGHLAAGEKTFHKNYITSVNLVALKATGDTKYDATIARAAGYLRKAQTGADDGKKPDDPNYGGFGYGPGTRSDLSNTHFVLDSLKVAGTSPDDPVYKRAVVFVSRMQNLKSEFNDQPWAGTINDGSFIYVLPQPGAKGDPADPRPGYGSMTAAGLKGLLQCGVSRDDPRVRKAIEWLAKNYSVDVNPGRQDGAGGQGYYYYLLTLAKAFDALGEDEFTDAAGKKHDWRADITRALVNRQKRDGSWSNDFPTWMEGDPNLCTGYALQTLAVSRPKSK
jgi:squalene-hopene/tetraprenyl-beta-curcumene cyclase